MRYAIIKNSIVENIVEWDEVSVFICDGQLVKIEDNFVDIGYKFEDGVFKINDNT